MNSTTIASALANLEAKLLDATVSPKPTYSIDGQSVQWNEYLRMLMDGIKDLNEMLAIADPVEKRTVAA